jgi:uncharacterized membrane protein
VDPLSLKRKRLELWLTTVLIIAALDTIYLAWRFTALFAGWVTPGTSICSWTTWIDCDKVLQTPQARAFIVPNAILAVGFYTGALIWWSVGRRLGEGYRHHLVRTLAFWLGVASLLTFRFWALLLSLDHLCPFCPWNHVLTYVAFFLAIRIWQLTPRPLEHQSLRPLLMLVALCVVWFWSWQVGWFVAEAVILKYR